jgi:hypothetical protein
MIETGVWRGGATIFMRALLQAHGIADRNVWVEDSFAGLPPRMLRLIRRRHVIVTIPSSISWCRRRRLSATSNLWPTR